MAHFPIACLPGSFHPALSPPPVFCPMAFCFAPVFLRRYLPGVFLLIPVSLYLASNLPVLCGLGYLPTAHLDSPSCRATGCNLLCFQQMFYICSSCLSLVALLTQSTDYPSPILCSNWSSLKAHAALLAAPFHPDWLPCTSNNSTYLLDYSLPRLRIDSIFLIKFPVYTIPR